MFGILQKGICQLQRGEYLMRRHDFGKIPYQQERWKKIQILLPERQKMPPLALPTTHPPLCGSLVIAGYEIILF